MLDAKTAKEMSIKNFKIQLNIIESEINKCIEHAINKGQFTISYELNEYLNIGTLIINLEKHGYICKTYICNYTYKRMLDISWE